MFKLLPTRVIAALQLPVAVVENKYFSQEGEDIVLSRFLEGQRSGFYVDIGAHHPTRFSNTYLFYLRGWHGINIDAMPGSMAEFKKLRPRDINVEAAISFEKGNLPYFIFNEPALNTFSRREASTKDGLASFKIVKTMTIETQPLSNVLDQYVPAGQHIDFMSIDVEGFDIHVLRSNNWTKYQPTYLLIELLDLPLQNLHVNETSRYLQELGYLPIAKTYNTFFFKKTR